ncbi:MAG: hypothetical protein GVY30_08355 [Chloroflexi bacterium]|jgi:hypothetical protein|nr:hypothetical protein [Chloroflexota bacterium]
MDARQLAFRFDEMLDEQHKTQKLLRTMAQSFEAASKHSQEDADLVIKALDDLREQIKDLTDVMAEANGLWR